MISRTFRPDIFLQRCKSNPSCRGCLFCLLVLPGLKGPAHPPSLTFSATLSSETPTVEKQLSSFKYIPGCSLHVLSLSENWLPPDYSTSLLVLSLKGSFFSTSQELQNQVNSQCFLHSPLPFPTITPSSSHI